MGRRKKGLGISMLHEAAFAVEAQGMHGFIQPKPAGYLPHAKACVGHYGYHRLLPGLNSFVHCLRLLGITYKSCVKGSMKSSHGTDWIRTDPSTSHGGRPNPLYVWAPRGQVPRRLYRLSGQEANGKSLDWRPVEEQPLCVIS